MKIVVTSFNRSCTLPHTVPPTLKQATADPLLHWRLPDTHRQVWVSLLWDHSPFSGVLVHTKFCLCPPKVCFPVLCKFYNQNPLSSKAKLPGGSQPPLPDSQVGKYVVGPRTLLIVQEFI